MRGDHLCAGRPSYLIVTSRRLSYPRFTFLPGSGGVAPFSTKSMQKKCEFEKSKAQGNLTTEHLGDMVYPDALFS